MEEGLSLHSSLCIPSSSNSYGIAIEYIRNWFLSKFDKDYWKTVHIDGKFVLDDFSSFNHTTSLKRSKPAVAIVPQINFEHDREGLDLYQGSIDQLIRRSRVDSSFFRDYDRNLYVALMMEQLQMNFTFRMKVSSRAQQVELYKYVQMAFRIGSTQGEDIDIDFHLPPSLVLQIAKDSGFEIEDGRIRNVGSFLSYLNSNSVLPVLYKYRNINGNNEFFIRMSNIYTHISCKDYLSADDGEREGMIFNNFMIDFNIVLKMPIPKAYAYYSYTESDILKRIDNTVVGNHSVLNIELLDIPDKNSKGWDKFILTDYYEEDISIPLSIDFTELFDNTNILKVIKYNNSIQVSSSIFIDFIIFNNNKKYDYTIDWDTLQLNTDSIMDLETTLIVIYVDMNYINESLISINKLYEDRLR